MKVILHLKSKSSMTGETNWKDNNEVAEVLTTKKVLVFNNAIVPVGNIDFVEVLTK
ncbi:hypothetical protein PSYJYH_000011 [Bacillus phage PSYJ-YH]|nr:hypothetical protein PSYJYH_000011 [Bacillus phage PSYJ-YH]